MCFDMVEIMVFLSEVFLITPKSSWIIKNKTHLKTSFFHLDKQLLTFLLYSLRIVSKIHSITERKKNEKIATVSLAKYDQNARIFIYFFVHLLQLDDSKDLLLLRLLGVEKV